MTPQVEVAQGKVTDNNYTHLNSTGCLQVRQFLLKIQEYFYTYKNHQSVLEKVQIHKRH